MRLKLVRLLIAFAILTGFSVTSFAQNCLNTGLNHSVINLPCNQNCVNVPVRIPDLKSTETYQVVSIPYTPYAYTTGAPALTHPCTTGGSPQDDKFFDTTFLPFKFCFYGKEYTKLAIGTNGVVTFDSLNALRGCNWDLNSSTQLPYAGSGIQGTGTCPTPQDPLFPRAAIMGAYYDLYIDASTSPNKKVEARVEGSAPCRRFIISFFEVPLFSCTNSFGTQQIVLYESTGIIEIFIGNKPSCSFNEGRAVLGIQNWDRDAAVTAPGKNSTVWTESNTGYRFVPSGATSRFVSCQIETLAGAFIANGTVTNTTPGQLDVTFPSLCPATATQDYVIKTVFAACDNPANQLTSIDTITVNKTNSLNATATTTQTACGAVGTGTITVTVPAGIGTGPFTFVLDGGTPVTGPSPHTFTAVAGGSHTVVVTDASGGCTSNIPVSVTSTGTLAVNITSTNTTCTGVNNGTITVNVPNANNPLTYYVNLIPRPGPTFTNLAPGTYFISVEDAGGCRADFIPVTIDAGTGTLTGTATAAPTACPGVNNGAITVTPTSGTGPYDYSIDGGTNWQTSNIFPGLAPGNYTIIIRESGLCRSNPIPVTVASGTGIAANVTNTATACTGISNGSITITPTNGTGPFTFILDGTTTQTGATSTTFTGLAAGAHSITITDAAGCSSTAPFTSTIATGGGFTATFTPTATSCAGATNGSLAITPGTGGTAPYTFVLDGTTTQTGTTTTFTGLAAGNHTVVITDANGCRFTINNATVPAGAGLTAGFTNTGTACTGINNGTITVTPTNGTGPYTFVLDGTTTQTGATSTTFTGLTSGSHSVTITDASGCSTTAPLTTTVAAGAGFTATATTTATSCAGAANGSITVTPGTGGTAPYTFVLNGSITQNGATTTFTNVPAGPHSILITDANGCQFTLNNVTVAAGAGLAATITTVPTACTGVSNGSVTVTPTNGTGPYTFILDALTMQSGAASTTFTGLGAGPHTITITDVNGCVTTAPLTATVATGGGFTAAATTTATSCNGASNGSITVTPGTGGTAPYTFVLDGTTTQTGNTTTFNGVASGTHSVLITDVNGCQFTIATINVAAGPSLAATVTPVATACPGVSNGSITITPTNGTGPYTFVLDGATTQTGATSTTFAGVAAGSHTIQVADAGGCSVTLPPVTVASGTGVTANINPVSTSCIGASNGSIAVSPTNGTAPYTVTLNGTTVLTGPVVTFTGLAPGSSYTIDIRDAIGCTGSYTNITVPQGSALLATATPTATTCNTATNGQIVVRPTNGGGPYTFVLTPGNITQTGAASTTFTGLAAGSYSVVVRDAANCVSSPVTATITAGPAVTTTASHVNVSCNGGNDGSITVTQPAVGTAPFEYSLNNTTWQTSPTFAGLVANNYTVYFREANGCGGQLSVTITQPPVLSFTATNKAVSCNGAADGLITVTATGGTSNYAYSLNNVTYQPGNTFTVVAGSYTVYVRDAKGCVTPPQTIVVAQPAVLTATNAAPTNATCNGGNDGTITVTATGGTAPYQYSSNGTSFQASNVLNVGPGTYSATVKDANGCTFVIPNITVGLTDNLTFTPMTDPAPICESKSVQLEIISNATSYAWTSTTGDGLSSVTAPNPVASPTTSTVYTVTMTLGRCMHTDDVAVTVWPAPIPDAGDNIEICYGLDTQLQGSGGTTYNWTPSTYLSSAIDPNADVIQPEKSISYSLSVTDANGCTSLVTDQVQVKVIPPFEVLTFPRDTVVYDNVQVPMLAIAPLQNVLPEDISYEWTPSIGLDNPNIPNPVATSSMIGDTIVYLVTATTPAGCQGTGTVTVKVFKGPELYTPNAFTPNRDGRNDTFYPFPVGVKTLNYFQVYNRWGQLVYSTKTLNQGWDGKLNFLDQPSGVYVWMAEGVTLEGQKITRKGTVTLIR